MSYISLSEKDRKEMLSTLGISSLDELFQMIPDDIKLRQEMAIPGSLTEPELIRYFKEIAQKNTHSQFLSFLGAGAYLHFIPAIVNYLSSRGEFVTPYTPYQPEISQGTLQVIFEFQTLICQLTGMDVSNASLYDGASATAEAVLMAHRLKRRPKVLISRFLHPQYRETIQTYSKNLGVSVDEIDHSKSGEIDLRHLNERLDEETTAVVVQSPNFMGIIEDIQTISKHAHSKGALSVIAVPEPVSLGILEAPGNLGADIVTGEGQSFGIPVSFGGPYLGFMACAEDFLRQFPGRIAGETSDVEGKRGYVLTLSTREQHIRRERATSNICTNQAWCALRATIFLETLGKEGMRELARQNSQKAYYALEKLSRMKGVEHKFSGEVFNEFVLEFEKPWSDIEKFLRGKGILGGLGLQEHYPELKNCALFCVTEVHKREDIDKLADALEEALSSQ
jgi:glycine dehydrogenase subunit 1